MDTKKLELWEKITFKTEGYRKNNGFLNNDESIVTEYDGTITEVRLSTRKPPLTVGEYGFSVWNLKVARELNINVFELINEHSFETSYKQLKKIIKLNGLELDEYDKLVLVHTFIINQEYRKYDLSEEFTEMLYLDYYDDKTAIIALVMPFQDNDIDADHYLNKKLIPIRENFDPNDAIFISAREYYSLDDLIKKDDTEMNEYKLFAVASRCGFSRILESHLFLLDTDIALERMKKKKEFTEMIDDIKY